MFRFRFMIDSLIKKLSRIEQLRRISIWVFLEGNTYSQEYFQSLIKSAKMSNQVASKSDPETVQ